MAWSATIEGTSPPLTVYERTDRNGQLYIKWSDGNSWRRPKLRKLASVRDEDGRIDSDLANRARGLALAQYRKARAEDEGSSSTPCNGPLTLGQGRDLVIAVPGGKYATKSQQREAMRLALDRAGEILGEDRPWEDLKPRDYQELWRTFARRNASGKWDLGWRMAEQTTQLLLAATNWLHEQGKIDVAPHPPSRWRGKLKADWQEILDLHKRPEPHRPRYSEEEMERLWRHLPSADPRLQLAVGLGAEFRVGQAKRSWRSDLNLSPEAGIGHGTFAIHGRLRKKGEVIHLIPEQRALVDGALDLETGHLRDFERAYLAGELEDYPLFPGGELQDGKLPFQQPFVHMHRRTLLTYFHKLEAAAGVEHMGGRAFYGIRRRSTDETRKHTKDERVLDASGGWTPHSGTRGKIYMNPDDPDVRKAAARVRRLTRGYAEADANVGGQDGIAKAKRALRNVLRNRGVPEDRLDDIFELVLKTAA